MHFSVPKASVKTHVFPVHSVCWYDESPVPMAAGLAISGLDGSMLFPKSGIVTVVDEGKWSPRREEFGSSRIITMGVNSVATADQSVFKHVVICILRVVTLKNKVNKFDVKQRTLQACGPQDVPEEVVV